MSWPDGTQYIGEWKNDLRHGQGTLYENGKIIAKGEFVNDVFADNNCVLRIKKKYELITLDRYTGQENGRRIADIKKLVEYKLGANEKNPIYPQYGANNVYVINATIDIIENGRIRDREIRAFDCIVNSSQKIVGIERNQR